MTTAPPEPAKSPWVNHYFVILPNARGDAILMLPTAAGWQLPYARGEGIWLAEAARIIPLLQNALNLDFDFTVLRHAHYHENEAERWDQLLVVLEPAHPLEQPPLGGQWVDRAMLPTLPFANPDQRASLHTYLNENAQDKHPIKIDARRAPWARPGWFATASTWIKAAIVEQDITQTGKIEQLRNWSISSVLYAPTTAGRLFFKAAAALPLFVNEPALTQTLAKLYPGLVPVPLKTDRAKRWMLMQDFGASTWQDGNIDLAPILRAFGQLQRDSAHHLPKLFAAGCIDRRLHVLAQQIDPLVADPVTQSALSPQEYAELVALVPYLKERCARVAAYNIAPALLHGDLNMGNMIQRGSDYIFFDWTDAAISFPFLDMFLLYFPDEETPNAETPNEETTNVARWRDAYLEAWHNDESPQRLLEAWELAKPLCALHHAVSYLSIAHNIEPLTRDELFHGLPDNLRRILNAMRD